MVARLPGSDSNNFETVVVGAHYDHLGIRRPVAGDSIYNGADDASGATGILEITAGLAARKEVEGAGSLVVIGVLAVLFGVLLLMAPLAFGQLIVRILGAYAIVFGISLITLAFRVRRLGQALGEASR